MPGDEQLHVRVSEDTMASLRAEAAASGQSVTELVVNALDARPGRGDQDASVRVTMDAVREVVREEVADIRRLAWMSAALSQVTLYAARVVRQRVEDLAEDLVPDGPPWEYEGATALELGIEAADEWGPERLRDRLTEMRAEEEAERRAEDAGQAAQGEDDGDG